MIAINNTPLVILNYLSKQKLISNYVFQNPKLKIRRDTFVTKKKIVAVVSTLQRGDKFFLLYEVLT
jgi:hypothetical protein